jgi:hypothetical protein
VTDGGEKAATTRESSAAKVASPTKTNAKKAKLAIKREVTDDGMEPIPMGVDEEATLALSSLNVDSD